MKRTSPILGWETNTNLKNIPRAGAGANLFKKKNKTQKPTTLRITANFLYHWHLIIMMW